MRECKDVELLTMFGRMFHFCSCRSALKTSSRGVVATYNLQLQSGISASSCNPHNVTNNQMFYPNWHCRHLTIFIRKWWDGAVVQAMVDCSECQRTRGIAIQRQERQYSEFPGLASFQPFKPPISNVLCISTFSAMDFKWRFAIAYQPLQDMRAERNRQQKHLIKSWDLHWALEWDTWAQVVRNGWKRLDSWSPEYFGPFCLLN